MLFTDTPPHFCDEFPEQVEKQHFEQAVFPNEFTQLQVFLIY